MPYSKFTLSKAVEDFHLTVISGSRFLPEISPISPTALLKDILKETLPWAIARKLSRNPSGSPVAYGGRTPVPYGGRPAFRTGSPPSAPDSPQTLYIFVVRGV